MPYTINIQPSAERQFKKLPKPAQRQVINTILTLANDPRPNGCELLKSKKGFWRVRTGDYRIIYTVSDKELIVLVIKIGNHKDIYKMFKNIK